MFKINIKIWHCMCLYMYIANWSCFWFLKLVKVSIQSTCHISKKSAKQTQFDFICKIDFFPFQAFKFIMPLFYNYIITSLIFMLSLVWSAYFQLKQSDLNISVFTMFYQKTDRTEYTVCKSLKECIYGITAFILNELHKPTFHHNCFKMLKIHNLWYF